jgi:hypothetical protein
VLLQPPVVELPPAELPLVSDPPPVPVLVVIAPPAPTAALLLAPVVPAPPAPVAEDEPPVVLVESFAFEPPQARTAAIGTTRRRAEWEGIEPLTKATAIPVRPFALAVRLAGNLSIRE